MNNKPKKIPATDIEPNEQNAPDTSQQDYKPPEDAADLSDLIDDGDQDDIAEGALSSVAIKRPKGYFMVCPLQSYRKRMGIYVHEVEGKTTKTFYGVTKAMRAEIAEAHPCVLVTVVNRLGVPSLWPVKLPSDDGDDYDAWKALRKICKKAMSRWIRIVKWTGGSYLTRYAPPGYAPVPDWSALPPYTDLLAQALGKDGIIRDREHPIYKDLMGLDQKRDVEDDDDDDDL